MLATMSDSFTDQSQPSYEFQPLRGTLAAAATRSQRSSADRPPSTEKEGELTSMRSNSTNEPQHTPSTANNSDTDNSSITTKAVTKAVNRLRDWRA